MAFELLKNDFLEFGKNAFPNPIINSYSENLNQQQYLEREYFQFPNQENFIPLSNEYSYNHNIMNNNTPVLINFSYPFYYGCNIFYPSCNYE